MNSTGTPLKEGCSPRAIEEASVWLTLLRGPRRTSEVERGFRRWQEQDADNQVAFEAVTSMWELAERLPRPALPLPQRWARADLRSGMIRSFSAAAAVVVLMLGIVVWYAYSAGVATDIGEQRTLTLQDGTRVYLNTDTRVVVRYTDERRGVELKTGEALFEVAPHGPEWPFVVTAGDKQVTALGTAFIVRRDENVLSVTLVEGKVNVAPLQAAPMAAAPKPQVLSAGERVTFEKQSVPKLDRPVMEQVTAWRRGRVELDDTPLAAAVLEMNRYTHLKIAIEQPETAQILVKGAFRAGDTVSFAQSVASTCQLLVIQKPHEILLAGPPGDNCR